jgi:hypothetical protein
MRLYGVLCAVCGACASAGSPSEATDAAFDAPSNRDAAIDAPGTADAAINTCSTAMTCAGAMMLGTVSGDTASAVLTASGTTAAWFRVRVTEDESDLGGEELKLSSKLTFPVAVGFETYVYVNENSDVSAECATTTGTRSTVGNVQTVNAEWGEGTISNGSSDDRNVTVEVRAVGTNCSAAQMWSLELKGD